PPKAATPPTRKTRRSCTKPRSPERGFVAFALQLPGVSAEELPMRTRADGFTLVELLIVVVILGILGAIVAIGVAGFTDSSEQQGCKTERDQLRNAVEGYVATHTNTDRDELDDWAT